MTEESLINAMVGRTAVGSIGIASYKVEVRLDNVDPATGEGEIVCRGDNVMLGYYKDPERTLKVIDDEGWFHTNDIAVKDRYDNYYIKGRLNNTILGPSGENIYPEEIEQVINAMENVNESLVVERKGRLVALIYPEIPDDLNKTARAAIPELIRTTANKSLPVYSKINEVVFVAEPFEKTPKMSIKRYLYR